MSNESKELVTMENSGYLAATVNLGDLFSEEMDGLTPTFDRIKIPAGGGISFAIRNRLEKAAGFHRIDAETLPPLEGRCPEGTEGTK